MRHLVLALLMLTACGAVVLAAKDQPALAAESTQKDDAPAKKDGPAKKDDASKKDDAAKKDAGKPVNKLCPVEPEHEIDPKVTTTHDGKVIGFCCDGCIDTFKADPKKYTKNMK